MGPGKAFVDVLQEYLQPDARPRGPGPRSAVLTQPFVWIEQHLRPTVVAEVTRAAYVPPVTGVLPVRPSRRLTKAQQQALDTIVELGASLDADFTEHDLRAAHRGLALRYHPDRHPGAGVQELSRLAALFSRANAACERLTSIPQVVH